MKTRSIKNILLPAALLALLILPLAAQEADNSLFAYMRLGTGARVIAMGEAGSAVTRDVASAYWNPAGLMAMKDFEVSTMANLSLNNDRRHTYVSAGNRFGLGALALSWINAGVGDIDGYDDNGEPTGTFSDDEHSFALSYANQIGRFSFGITPKYYLSTIDGDSETGYSLDAGAMYDVSQYLEIGIMARDIYGKFGGIEVPYDLSAGLAVYPLLGLTLAADAKLGQDEDPYFVFGAEYWTSIGSDTEADSKLSVVSVSERNSWEEALTSLQTGLRLGFNQGRISAGTGIRFRNFQLDYAYRLSNHDIFGDDHIISLTLRF